MKKWLALLTVLTALCLLAACGTQDAPRQTETSQATVAGQDEQTVAAPLVNVGDYTDVPGNACSDEVMGEYEVLRVEMVDAWDYHYIYAFETSFSTNTDYMYIYDEYYEQEIVNVIKGDSVTRYIRSLGDPKFTQDTFADQTIYAEDLQEFTNVIHSLTSFSQPQDGMRYRRLEDVTAETGAAYAYEAYYNGELFGCLWIDQATGIPVFRTDAGGQTVFTVTAISTTDADIPSYK